MFNILKVLFARKKCTKKEALNIVDSIAKSKSLYKKLIKSAHPDKNPTQKEIAQELTNRLNANKFNYAELIKIEKEIHTKLIKCNEDY